MKKIHMLFCGYVLLLLALPAVLTWKGPILYGALPSYTLPKFSYSSYWKGNFQKDFVKYWDSNYGGINFALKSKNTIYAWINFGLFHSGYSYGIIQGKDRTLYECSYLQSYFMNVKSEALQPLIAQNVQKICELRDLLHKRGIDFALIVPPTKVESRFDELPFIWDLQKKYGTHFDAYAAYEPLLQTNGISYIFGVNELKSLSIFHQSFSRSGTHWNMLGADATFRAMLRKLNDSQSRSFSHYEPYRVNGVSYTTEERHVERDIARLLNVHSKNYKDELFPVIDYNNGNRPPVPMAIHGNSFSLELYDTVIDSGFSDAKNTFIFSNHIPTRTEMLSVLKKCKLFVSVWTTPDLCSSRISTELSAMLNVLKENEPKS